MSSIRAVHALLVLLLVPEVPLPGQAPVASPAEPSIGTTTRVVRVDVVAEDEDGMPVSDLRREELILTDDGRREDLVSFTAPVSRPKARAAPESLPPNTFTNRLEKLRGRLPSVTAILFDGLNTPMADREFARHQVVGFLRQIPRGSWVSLYTMGRGPRVLQDFTTDPEPLIRALEADRGEPQAELAEAPLPTLDAGLERFDSWIDELKLDLVEHYAEDRALRTIRALVAIANHLERVPGPKSLVWVSGSFPMAWIGRDSVPLPGRPASSNEGFQPEIERAARALAGSSLVVYPVDARGVRGTGEYDPGRESISRQARFADRSGLAVMQTLAERTGGRAFVNTNDLGQALRRALEDSRSTYSLGYEPSHDEWNGEFRRIEVKTTRTGVRLRHRRGYFAQPGEPAEDWYRSRVLQAAMWSPLDASRLGLTVRVTPGSGGRLTLTLRLHAPDVALQPAGDRWRGRLDVWIVQLGPENELVDDVSHVVELSLTPADHRRMMRTNEIVVLEGLTRQESAVLLRVLVRDITSGALGSLSIPLDQVEPDPSRNPA